VLKFIVINFLGPKMAPHRTVGSNFANFCKCNHWKVWNDLLSSFMSLNNTRRSMLGRKVHDIILELDTNVMEGADKDFSGNWEWLGKSITINTLTDLNIKHLLLQEIENHVEYNEKFTNEFKVLSSDTSNKFVSEIKWNWKDNVYHANFLKNCGFPPFILWDQLGKSNVFDEKLIKCQKTTTGTATTGKDKARPVVKSGSDEVLPEKERLGSGQKIIIVPSKTGDSGQNKSIHSVRNI
jgi:hypothetical protein